MTKFHSSPDSSNSKDSEYFSLGKKQKKSYWQHAKAILLFPYHLYQIIIGRILSYCLINPLFRKEEKNQTLLAQHPKHPDELFDETRDEMFIVNVIPKTHWFSRIMLNWHRFLTTHSLAAQIANALFYPLCYLFKKNQTVSDYLMERYLDKIVALIQDKIDTSTLSPAQIHFRRLEQLTESQQQAFYQKLHTVFKHDFRQNKKEVLFYSLETLDNALLDSVEIRPPQTEQNITQRRFIITCMPRSNNYIDWLKQYKIYARETNATIIAFNYRGVGLSQGIITNEHDLYADAHAQVQRLLSLGVEPQHIALMGECLGANIATHTAGTLHQEGFPVKLFNARSFRSATSLIAGLMLVEKNASYLNPLNWLRVTGYWTVQLILKPILYSANWTLDVEEQFLAIPPHDRDYLVVRSKKDEQGQRHADDKQIAHKEASIYSLAKKQTQRIQQKQKTGCSLSDEEQEWLHDVPKQHKFHVSAQHYTQAANINGHTAPSRTLLKTNPEPENPSVDGRQYSINFFKRVWSEHTKPVPESVLTAHYV